ncbi:MAG: hypothetical protein K5979_09895 [Ruminococcus sp.]|nr:hypothetical protein [Ruminococcus sp.]
MVITAVHEKNDVFLKKYITHLPVRPEEESKQSLKIISYLYQLEYQSYDAYLKENASVTQKIQEINLFDSALLTEKSKVIIKSCGILSASQKEYYLRLCQSRHNAG